MQKPEDPIKYNAHVLFIGHDTELALLAVDDASFFTGTLPARMGSFPQQMDPIAVYGFPVGGNDLSITEGVVSRIDTQMYVHSRREFLAIQTDAAINPGNSGGPAFKDGSMIGLAFQTVPSSQSTSYIIPIPLINRFLEDIKDSAYNGIPSLGAITQKIENPSLRQSLKMADADQGVLVTEVMYQSPAWNVIQKK